MKKANVECHGIKYKFQTIIETLEDLIEYHELDFGKKVKVSQEAIVDRIKRNYKGHDTDTLTNISEIFADLKGITPLDELHYLQTTVLKNQIEDILNNKILVVNKNGGYFPVKKSDDATIEYLNVKYTDKDIEIKKYPFGKHYYAKVKGIDVIDKEGRAKWNTYSYAYKQAVKFVIELNNKNK